MRNQIDVPVPGQPLLGDFADGRVFPASHGNPWTAAIAVRIGRELAMMQEILGSHADHRAFLAVDEWVRSTLRRIGDLLSEGVIDPAGVAARGANAPGGHRDGRPFRIGVFPTAGDPLHWAHLLSGLAAMERFRLDKVLYMIAGDDPRKPDLTPAKVRHSIAKQVLDLFHPLFEYSPMALGGIEPGEVNVFRIMGSSGARALHAFYLAGSDHFHRFAPLTRNPDTVERLEEGIRMRMHGFDPRIHELSAVFIDRGNDREPVDSFLDIRWVDHLPLRTSSTLIRDALGGHQPLYELAALPFTAYCAICVQGMYQTRHEGAPATLCSLRCPDPEEGDRYAV